jgi:hypothetical protein
VNEKPKIWIRYKGYEWELSHTDQTDWSPYELSMFWEVCEIV